MNPTLWQSILELQSSLKENRMVVLSLPPGLGKTTIVPIYLLEEDWLKGKKILIVEPRRLAAKNASIRVSQNLGEKNGELSGYRIRQESKISSRTRLEFVTDGVFLRILQKDPTLDGYGLVILDEFHERKSLYDLGLSILVESIRLFELPLKILFMSATINSQEISSRWNNCPVITANTPAFPTEIIYYNSTENKLVSKIMKCLSSALTKEGDILVFVTGKKEIYLLMQKIQEKYDTSVVPYPLHGELSLEEQQKAMFADSSGKRRIVIATNIAESSVTIEGIRIVIDSGLYKCMKYNPATGLNKLVVQEIAKDSMVQRAGRGNRIGPGIVYRLWNREDEKERLEYTTPEILYSDLSSILLETSFFGVPFYSLQWMNPPPVPNFERAYELLLSLDAIESETQITEKGKKMLEFPAHPRISHMILESEKYNLTDLACLLGAFLTNGDFLERGDVSQEDISSRIEILLENGTKNFSTRPILQLYDEFKNIIKRKKESLEKWRDKIGFLLAIAYPDRIGKQREKSRIYKLSSGKSAFFGENSLLPDSEYIVVPELEVREKDSRILLYAPLNQKSIEVLFESKWKENLEFNLEKDRFVFQKKRYLGEILWDSKEISNKGEEVFQRKIAEYLKDSNYKDLSITEEIESFIARIQFLFLHGVLEKNIHAQIFQEKPDLLFPYLSHVKSRQDIQKINLMEILNSLLDYSEKKILDFEAPMYFQSPAGYKIPIRYEGGEAFVSIKLQELFGTLETPKIANNRIPITFKLLSPAARPIQITKDLQSFWKNTYPEVKKELKGKYPKHPWPDNPMEAIPTRGTKRTLK